MLLLVTLITGCVSKKATLDEYVDPSEPIGDMGSIAVFPPADDSFEPQEVQQLTRKISDGVHARHPDMKIMDDRDVRKVMEDQGLAGDWARFRESYATSGKPDQALLGKMGNALGVDGILLGEIVSTTQHDRDYEDSEGVTRATVRFSLFDIESGKLAWQAGSEGVVKMQTMATAAPPVREAVEVAVDKIMGAFPR
jgi:hypothetical protein